jgi:hypothetical protein
MVVGCFIYYVYTDTQMSKVAMIVQSALETMIAIWLTRVKKIGSSCAMITAASAQSIYISSLLARGRL